MYVRGRGKMRYLTGETMEPAPNDSSHAKWDAKNSRVMTWLVNSMEEDIGSNYMCYHTAKELWDNVNQIYSDLGTQSQVYELTLKLEEIRQGEDTVTKYFNSLKRLWQDLDLFNNYEWKCTHDCEHYKERVEDNRILKFLIGLNIEFDEVRGRIIGRQPLPSFGEVFSEVRHVDSRRLVMLGKKNSSNSVENSALAAEVHTSRHTNKRSNEKSRVWYDYCNKPCRMRETCWKLHGKSTNWKGSHEGLFNKTPAVLEADSALFNKEQINQLLKLLQFNSGSSRAPNASLAQAGALCGSLQPLQEDISCRFAERVRCRSG